MPINSLFILLMQLQLQHCSQVLKLKQAYFSLLQLDCAFTVWTCADLGKIFLFLFLLLLLHLSTSWFQTLDLCFITENHNLCWHYQAESVSPVMITTCNCSQCSCCITRQRFRGLVALKKNANFSSDSVNISFPS